MIEIDSIKNNEYEMTFDVDHGITGIDHLVCITGTKNSPDKTWLCFCDLVE
jgi:hypothetical protein